MLIKYIVNLTKPVLETQTSYTFNDDDASEIQKIQKIKGITLNNLEEFTF